MAPVSVRLRKLSGKPSGTTLSSLNKKKKPVIQDHPIDRAAYSGKNIALAEITADIREKARPVLGEVTLAVDISQTHKEYIQPLKSQCITRSIKVSEPGKILSASVN